MAPDEMTSNDSMIPILLNIFKPATIRYVEEIDLEVVHRHIVEQIKLLDMEAVRKIIGSLVVRFVTEQPMQPDEIRLLYCLDLSVEYIDELAELKSYIADTYLSEIKKYYEADVQAFIDKYGVRTEDQTTIWLIIDGLVTLSLKFPESPVKPKAEVLAYVEKKLQLMYGNK
jgi:hypothetical protein